MFRNDSEFFTKEKTVSEMDCKFPKYKNYREKYKKIQLRKPYSSTSSYGFAMMGMMNTVAQL